LDPATRPQDDLYRHVNGRWLSTYEIPADRARDGAFRTLADRAEEQVRDIITGAADGDPKGTLAKVGALYASFMDVETIDALGAAPLEPDLALIRSATSQEELTGSLGALQRTGAAGAVGFYVDNDAHDPERYVVYLYQGGLGLPDESYYREEHFAEIRAAYTAHIARMLTLAGVVAEDAAAAAAERVMALETRLAGHHWDVVRDRDANLTYNPTTLAELASSAPGFDWNAWSVALRVPGAAFTQIVVREPSYTQGFAELWTTEPLEDWKLWMAYHAVSARAPYMHSEL